MLRGIPTSAHAAVEMVAAPAIMAAPLLLGFAPTPGLVTFALGAVLLGHALQLGGPRRTIPVSAHAGVDYALAMIAVAAGAALAVGIGQWGPGSFLVGIGAAQVTLTAATRFSVPVRF